MLNLTTSILLCTVLLVMTQFGYSQKNNDFAVCLHISGFGGFFPDKTKNFYNIEVTPSIGIQMTENHYVFLLGGRSFSNFLDQELYFFGYLTRSYIHQYKFLRFYVGQTFTLTNLSYDRKEGNVIQKTNANISGFTFGVLAGVHIPIYRKFGINIDTGYNYDLGYKLYGGRRLNLTFQYAIH